MKLAEAGILEILPGVMLRPRVDAQIQLWTLRLLRCMLGFGMGLPTVIDLIEVFTQPAAHREVAPAKVLRNSDLHQLFVEWGITVTLTPDVAQEFVQTMEQAIPALTDAFTYFLADRRHLPSTASDKQPRALRIQGVELHDSLLIRLTCRLLLLASKASGWLFDRLAILPETELDANGTDPAVVIMHFVSSMHHTTFRTLADGVEYSLIDTVVAWLERAPNHPLRQELDRSFVEFRNSWQSALSRWELFTRVFSSTESRSEELVPFEFACARLYFAAVDASSAFPSPIPSRSRTTAPAFLSRWQTAHVPAITAPSEGRPVLPLVCVSP